MNRSSQKKITVLVCDDHALFREGVKTILNSQPDIEVVGEASDGKEAVQEAIRLSPDIILMDISMPVLKGFDAVRRIKKVRPDTKILILTVYDDEDLVARCLDAGAAGYVLKDSPPLQLVYAIQTVHHGEQYMSPRVLTGVVRQYIAQSLKEIATRLNLSVKTVDAHKYNLMRKLDLHDRSELIRYAIRKRLVEA